MYPATSFCEKYSVLSWLLCVFASGNLLPRVKIRSVVSGCAEMRCKENSYTFMRLDKTHIYCCFWAFVRKTFSKKFPKSNREEMRLDFFFFLKWLGVTQKIFIISFGEAVPPFPRSHHPEFLLNPPAERSGRDPESGKKSVHAYDQSWWLAIRYMVTRDE